MFNFGAKVMLTRNLWIKKGLCNGAVGIVKKIIYKEGQYPPVLPVSILKEFENFSGPSINGCVPIIPIVSSATTSENLERHQLPLKLYWGITIDKSQRLILSNAIIDIRAKDSVAGLAYTAISRVGKLSDLIIEPTALDRLNAVKKTKNFQCCLDEENSFTLHHQIWSPNTSPKKEFL